MFKIGNIEIKNKIVLAPMAGITNQAYRSISHQMGAGLTVGEMVSDKALCFNNQNTFDMLKIDDDEGIVSMQLFGGEVETMVKAAKIIDENCKAPIIDINMGCPVPKVLRANAGSKLLQDPDLAYEIVKNIVENVSKPVTVKMRIGWDLNSINIVEMAKKMEKAKASAIAVHARTKTQMYEGVSDWKYIKMAKQAVSIPVIGNGDIRSCYDARAMIEQTGCDAVMIGRGTLGNPWLIKECVDYLEHGILPTPISLEERIIMILKHAKLLIKVKDYEPIAIKEMRQHACWYFKGLENANKYKLLFNEMETLEGLTNILKQYYFENTGCELNIDLY